MVQLTFEEQAMRAGDGGPAQALAMRVVTGLAEMTAAPRLVSVASAHIDGCLYHGQAGLDFAERLAQLGGRVVVPTSLNVGSLDLLHPELVKGTQAFQEAGRRLMDVYVAMGCAATWTCAPYQLSVRPRFGEDIAWAESNAIAFANSVIGARTDRYGDFIDIAAALVGRVPYAGLHVADNRFATLVMDVTPLPQAVLDQESFYPILGHMIGSVAGVRVPAVVGIPEDCSEDRLKAVAAAAASSGGVALFHVVGVTPEATTLQEALGNRQPTETVEIDLVTFKAARDELTTSSGPDLDAVSVGTPHMSLEEVDGLCRAFAGRRVAPGIDFYASMARHTLEAASGRGLTTVLDDAGVTVVVDTCTYVTPILRDGVRVVMTNSGKWAYYAPSNLGVDVVFGSTQECVESAVAGTVSLDGAFE
jgi:predicted aconitase